MSMTHVTFVITLVILFHVNAIDSYDNFKDLNLSSNISASCASDYQVISSALVAPAEEWALQMADATGKEESGRLDGNTVFEGRYAQCKRAISSEVENTPDFDSLYCLAFWITLLPADIPIYRSGFGMCIPDSCTNDDALVLLDTVYNSSGQQWSEKNVVCQREKDLSGDAGAIVSIFILSLFGLLVVVGTTWDGYGQVENNAQESNDQQDNRVASDPMQYNNAAFQNGTEADYKDGNLDSMPEQLDIKGAHTLSVNQTSSQIQLTEVDGNSLPQEESERNQTVTDAASGTTYSKAIHILKDVLCCFSLYKNTPLIINPSPSVGRYGCINGLRVIAMCALILGQSYVYIVDFSENPNEYISTLFSPSFSKVAAIDLYIDTFFVLSGFLVTFSLLKKLKSQDGTITKADVGFYYFTRIWRLTPCYAIVLMVYTNLFPYFIEGPLVPDYITDVEACSTEWWKNLLYVNNLRLFITEGISCFDWSWYLAVDMQFYIMAPFFIYLLYKWEKIGIITLSLGFTGGFIANIVLWDKHFRSGSADPFIDIYIAPWARCPVYFMGMALGYVFYRTQGNIKFPKGAAYIGWALAILIYFMTAYVPAWGDCTYTLTNCDWTVSGKVAWSVFKRPLWGLWVCWVILACSTGHGGIINKFLSARVFVPFGKLTYLCYLIYLIIVFLYYFRVQVQLYFTHLTVIYIFCGNLIFSFLFAAIMALTIAAPLMNLPSAFLPYKVDNSLRYTRVTV